MRFYIYFIWTHELQQISGYDFGNVTLYFNCMYRLVYLCVFTFNILNYSWTYCYFESFHQKLPVVFIYTQETGNGMVVAVSEILMASGMFPFYQFGCGDFFRSRVPLAALTTLHHQDGRCLTKQSSKLHTPVKCCFRSLKKKKLAHCLYPMYEEQRCNSMKSLNVVFIECKNDSQKYFYASHHLMYLV